MQGTEQAVDSIIKRDLRLGAIRGIDPDAPEPVTEHIRFVGDMIVPQPDSDVAEEDAEEDALEVSPLWVSAEHRVAAPIFGFHEHRPSQEEAENLLFARQTEALLGQCSH